MTRDYKKQKNTRNLFTRHSFFSEGRRLPTFINLISTLNLQL